MPIWIESPDIEMWDEFPTEDKMGNTEEEKQLRQLIRQSHQLPEPDWNLFARATKRFSRLRAQQIPFKRIETQAAEQRKKENKRKYIRKQNETDKGSKK